MAPKLVLSLEHRARELLNGISLVTHCLKTQRPTAVERHEWKLRVVASRRKLESLYSEGLDRNFRNARAAIDPGHSPSSQGAGSLPATA
jgi:hypothetical protein